jgi:hypothetical protein
MRKTNLLQIIIFGLLRPAGPYRWAKTRHASAVYQLVRLNHSDELPPLPIDPRPSAERRRGATEIGTAVTGPNEVPNIDIRRRCETSQCFPCCRNGERRVPAQPVAEPRNFGIECFLSYDRFQISDSKQRVGRWHLGEEQHSFHPTHAQRGAKPTEIGGRKAVAQGACDRNAEPRA